MHQQGQPERRQDHGRRRQQRGAPTPATHRQHARRQAITARDSGPAGCRRRDHRGGCRPPPARRSREGVRRAGSAGIRRPALSWLLAGEDVEPPHERRTAAWSCAAARTPAATTTVNTMALSMGSEISACLVITARRRVPHGPEGTDNRAGPGAGRAAEDEGRDGSETTPAQVPSRNRPPGPGRSGGTFRSGQPAPPGSR